MNFTYPARLLPVLSLLGFAATLSVGCDVFDASLYMARDAGDAGDTSVTPDTGTVDGGATTPLADRCTDSPPSFVSRTDTVEVDTTSLSDRVSDIASCTGSSAPGNDGFFTVDMTAGESWHFHVTALEADGDPVVYVLGGGCDPRTCQRGDATNVCNLRDEHFTYVAPRDGTFFVGIDDAQGRGGSYEVLAVRRNCGNGTKEHSESCDGEADCTDECRNSLADGAAEVEPNDDPPGANELAFVSGTVLGDVASSCDLASYRVTVPEGGAIGASVLPRGQDTCNTSAPALDLELLSPDGRTLFGSVSSGPGECPTILGTEPFASGLSAGVYVLRIVPTDEEVARLYPFDLSVDVTTP